jgi:thymidylate synthase ThyX
VCLDRPAAIVIFEFVSVLQIKQSLSRLSPREQREIQVYLHQLRRRTPAWKKATAKKIEEVRAGKFTTIKQLEERYRRG